MCVFRPGRLEILIWKVLDSLPVDSKGEARPPSCGGEDEQIVYD